MQALQAQTPAQKELLESLNRFELGFLFDKLKSIEGISSLVKGTYGQNLLADIALRHKEQSKENYALAFATTPKLACETFAILAKIKRDFEEKYSQLERKDPSIALNAQKRTVAVAEAFVYAMEKNKITYPKEGIAVFNLALSLVGKLSDCDTSAILFIQFGREKGLDLIGAKAPKHYFAVLRENGKATLHIETTRMLAGGGLPGDIAADLKKLEWAAVKYANDRDELASERAALLQRPATAERDATLKTLIEAEAEIANKLKAIEENASVTKLHYSGIFSIPDWKEANPNSSYSYQEDHTLRLERFRLRTEMDNLEMNNPLLAEKSRKKRSATRALQSVRTFKDKAVADKPGWFSYRNTEQYQKARDEIKKAWEADEKNAALFSAYFGLLDFASSGPPILAADNERELFRLYKKGLEIFGSEALKKMHISISKRKILFNPVDHHNSLKD